MGVFVAADALLCVSVRVCARACVCPRGDAWTRGQVGAFVVASVLITVVVLVAVG